MYRKRLQIRENSFRVGIVLLNILISAYSCNEKEELKQINDNFQVERIEENDKHIQKLNEIAREYEEKRKEQYEKQKTELAKYTENERDSL